MFQKLQKSKQTLKKNKKEIRHHLSKKSKLDNQLHHKVKSLRLTNKFKLLQQSRKTNNLNAQTQSIKMQSLQKVENACLVINLNC